MTTVYDMLQRFESLDLPGLVVQSIEDTQLELIEKQSDQLLEGKNSLGDDISPSYLEDPYFKSKEQAQAYSDWKDEITPNPKRKKGVPNLYINGYYHNNLFVRVNGKEIDFDNASEFAADVERKYQKKLLSLNQEKTEEYAFGPFWSVLKSKIEEKLQLQFK